MQDLNEKFKTVEEELAFDGEWDFLDMEDSHFRYDNEVLYHKT